MRKHRRRGANRCGCDTPKKKIKKKKHKRRPLRLNGDKKALNQDKKKGAEKAEKEHQCGTIANLLNLERGQPEKPSDSRIHGPVAGTALRKKIQGGWKGAIDRRVKSI